MTLHRKIREAKRETAVQYLYNEVLQELFKSKTVFADFFFYHITEMILAELFPIKLFFNSSDLHRNVPIFSRKVRVFFSNLILISPTLRIIRMI